jgi:pyruvate formate lyase activating enzyme
VKPDHPARWWRADQGRIRCELCPRFCLLGEGQRGYCGVRVARGGELRTFLWNVHAGLAVDPIEKKPLFHVLPGSRTLSFGTAGCSLGCDFCQNWRMSRAAPEELGLKPATGREIVDSALAQGCGSIAFTYNEPSIGAEWCIEVAEEAHAAGLLAVAVSSAYVAEAAWEGFFGALDAVNLDLKGFTDGFYRRRCKAKLAPVLAALEAAVRCGVWVEITTLLIPGENDDDAGLTDEARWIAANLGREIPVHFTAFHPDFELLDRAPTRISTLRRAREIALAEGLRYVYTGNLPDPEGSASRCSACGELLVERSGYRILRDNLFGGACPRCGKALAGIFQGSRAAARPIPDRES